MMSKLIAAPALAAILLASGAHGAAATCGSTIAEFEATTAGDAARGNLNKAVHRRIAADLVHVKSACSAGRDAEATRALAAIKSRYGYR